MLSNKNNVVCAGCHNAIPGEQHLQCIKCNKLYDLLCANVSEEQFSKMTNEQKRNGVCQACKNSRPKGDNSNTPIRSLKDYACTDRASPREDEMENITKRKPAPLTSTRHSLINLDESTTSTAGIGIDLQSEISAAIKTALPSILTQIIRTELADVKNDIQEMKKSFEFLSSRHDEMQSSIDSLIGDNKQLKSANMILKTSVAELTDRLNRLEQNSRDSNLEINGVPEKRTENTLCRIYTQPCWAGK